MLLTLGPTMLFCFDASRPTHLTSRHWVSISQGVHFPSLNSAFLPFYQETDISIAHRPTAMAAVAHNAS